MQLPASCYFLFWATISVVFSRLGFNALDRTDLSKSVSPLLISLLKHSLAIFTCHSSIYAFVFRPQLKFNSFNKYILLFAIITYTVLYYPGASLPHWYFLIFISLNFVFFLESFFKPSNDPDGTLNLLILLAVGSSFSLVGESTRFFPCTVSCIAFFILTIYIAAISDNEIFRKLISLCGKGKEKLVTWKKMKKGKLVEYGIGMVGTVLFQNFFKLTSFDHVVAFLYFAVAWIADLSLLCASEDFGILNFLLSNVIIGCTVSNSGLRGTTWLVCGVSLVVHGIRLKLESLSLVMVNQGRQIEGVFSVGGEIEVLVF